MKHLSVRYAVRGYEDKYMLHLCIPSDMHPSRLIGHV
jgi:hypothetical protein